MPSCSVCWRRRHVDTYIPGVDCLFNIADPPDGAVGTRINVGDGKSLLITAVKGLLFELTAEHAKDMRYFKSCKSKLLIAL
eukprot:scaffold502555_cov17-Prasinocladus_malaysianus.AAC.1